MGLLPLDIVMYDADSELWLVVALVEDSPLAAAGVENGDEITAIALDGEPLTVDDLDEALANAADDAQAELTIERGDETLTVTLAAADLRSGFAFQRGPRMGSMGDRGTMPFGGHMMGGNVRLGVSYTMLDAELAAENDLDISEGALINEVLDDSPAAAAGLEAGDVITAVDGDVVDARRDLRERLYAYEPGDVVTLDVLRDGENLALEATLEAGEMNFNFGELPFEFELPLPPDMPEADPALPVT
jgi:S1-C subfamily serine protease